MSSEGLHERFEDVTAETRDLHRGIVSLMEELEAVDWYQQRVDATQDEDLKAVLAHNRDEEIEHAMMNLEWIRRRVPKFDETARIFLFSEGPITEVEEKMKAGAGAEDNKNDASSGDSSQQQSSKATTNTPQADGSLGIGSLKLA